MKLGARWRSLPASTIPSAGGPAEPDPRREAGWPGVAPAAGVKKPPVGGFVGSGRFACLLAGRHFALDTLDVEVHAAEELVVGHRVFGQHFLAVAADQRAFPDLEA